MSAVAGVASKLAPKAVLWEVKAVFCHDVPEVRQPAAGGGVTAALLTVTETEAVPALPDESLACAIRVWLALVRLAVLRLQLQTVVPVQEA
jgi:hypothetical protein